MAFLTWLSLFCVFYAYLGYPVTLFILNTFGLKPARNTTPFSRKELPRISMIITVRNEANVIREKLSNTFALSYGGQNVPNSMVELIVASDASDDDTDKIVAEYAKSGVKLVALPQRGGKETAQRAAIEVAQGEVMVFTDAKIRLESNALENFAAYFSDPTVGAVSSVDRVEGAVGSGEGMYVRYEMRLRELESAYDTLVGLSGSCFAVRKSVSDHIRTDIPSDFALLIEARRQGMRGVNAPDVVGSYQAVASEKAEFDRKVRTVLRGITTLFACKEVMNPSVYGSFAWQVISHKLMRWLVPFFLVIIAFGLFDLSLSVGGIYETLAIVMILFVAAAGAAFFSPAAKETIFCRVPLFFLLVNAGIAVAWWRYLGGQRSTAWTPSNKGA